MTSQSQDFKNQDEQWLDALLASPPALRDNGFSQHVWQHIVAVQRKRRIIFISMWLFIVALCLVFSPWAQLTDWMAILANSETSIFGRLLQLPTQIGREQMLDQLQQHWALFFAGFIIVAAFFKNLFAANL